MDYKTAVQAALNGDEDGFLYLYENTYTKMYHKALLYVKNKCDAEDILQDSYIKAGKNLDTLTDPDKFPIWFSEIVVNTSKNFLKSKKRKPITFFGLYNNLSDKEIDNYNIEDNNNLFQPEEHYSEKEIKTILAEMINSLSDEQRVCILLHHFDEQTVAEIAEHMSCSVGTVKSRLFYGRKALRKKVEDMQKQGYRFYGAAPIPILKYFIKKYISTSGFIESVNAAMENSKSTVISQISMTENISIISGAKNTSVWKMITTGAAVFAVSGSVLAIIKYSDFDGFVKQLEIKNETIENVSSVSLKNSTDTDTSDIIDNKIYDTDISYDIDKIADIKDTKDTAASVHKISNVYSTDTVSSTDEKKSSSSSSVRKPLVNDSSSSYSDNPTEATQNVTITREVPVNDSQSYSVASTVTDNVSSAITSDTDSVENINTLISEGYSQVLNSLDGTESESNKYEYYLTDIDNDGMLDMILIHYIGKAEETINDLGQVVSADDYRIKFIIEVYTFVKDDNGYKLQKLEKSFDNDVIFINLAKNPYYSDNDIYRMTGKRRSEYVFDPWNFESYISVLKNDNTLFFELAGESQNGNMIFFEFVGSNVIKIEKTGNNLEFEYVYEEDYESDLPNKYNLYGISDRTPFQDLN